MSGEEGTSEYEGRKTAFSLEFVRSPPGLILTANIVILFLCWTIMAGWNGAVYFVVHDQWSGRSGYYLTVSLIPWLILLVVFVLKMLRLHKRVPKVVNWSLTMAINCGIWALLLFIASCVIGNIASVGSTHSCEFTLCHHLGACAAFGIFGSIGLGAQAFLHFREWRSNSSGGPHSATSKPAEEGPGGEDY